MDTYLPAFRAAVDEGHAGSVMCAYNAINGAAGLRQRVPAARQLRGKWGFQGYVVSDCGAVHRHLQRAPLPRRPGRGVGASRCMRGMDNECVDFFTKVNDDHDYRPYIEAVQQGYLPESADRSRRSCGCSRPASSWACSIRQRWCRTPKSTRSSSTAPRTASWRASWPMSRWCC